MQVGFICPGGNKVTHYKKVNCSSETGIDNVRDVLTDYVTHVAPGNAEVPYKVLHLDEADSLSPKAQDSLRVLMDDCKKICRFIMTTNHITKINRALISRSKAIHFGPVPKELVVKRMLEIVGLEGYGEIIGEPDISRLYNRFDGDVRQILVELDAIINIMKHGDVPKEELFGKEIDLSVIETIIKKLATSKISEARRILYKYFRESGIERRDFLWNLFKYILKFNEISDEKKGKIVKAIGKCDINIRDKTNDIIHIDVLLCKISEVFE